MFNDKNHTRVSSASFEGCPVKLKQLVTCEYVFVGDSSWLHHVMCHLDDLVRELALDRPYPSDDLRYRHDFIVLNTTEYKQLVDK